MVDFLTKNWKYWMVRIQDFSSMNYYYNHYFKVRRLDFTEQQTTNHTSTSTENTSNMTYDVYWLSMAVSIVSRVGSLNYRLHNLQSKHWWACGQPLYIYGLESGGFLGWNLLCLVTIVKFQRCYGYSLFIFSWFNSARMLLNIMIINDNNISWMHFNFILFMNELIF